MSCVSGATLRQEKVCIIEQQKPGLKFMAQHYFCYLKGHYSDGKMCLHRWLHKVWMLCLLHNNARIEEADFSHFNNSICINLDAEMYKILTGPLYMLEDQ